jgi:hypothetical protein
MSFVRRYRFVFLAVIAAGLAVGAFLTLRTTDKPSADRPAGTLGPTPGPDSRGYINAKRAYLSRLEREDPQKPAAGLVSFTAFRKTSEIKAAIQGIRPSAVFVKFPSSEVEALQVRGTLEGAIADRATLLKKELTSEIPQLETQLHSATGSARADIQKLIDDQRKAISVVGPECSCVFAVAVETTTVKALGDLQRRLDVRLVDVPDPLSATLRGWRLTPLLPAMA